MRLDLPPIPIPCGHNTFSSGCNLCNMTANDWRYQARFGMPIKMRNEAPVEEDSMGNVLIPCGHPNHSSGCHHCELAARDPRYAKLFSREYRGPSFEAEPTNPQLKYSLSVIKDRCVYIGNRLENSPSCGCGPLYACEKFGSCRITNPGPTGSKTCLNCEERKLRSDLIPNPKAGVVIGCYGFPNLVELQVKLIQKHNPGVPILLVDDCSDGTTMTPVADTNFGKICSLQKKYKDVLVWSNPTRMGHAGGDLTSYFTGVQFAAVRNLDCLVKLSFRFLVDIPNWIQIWMDDFWKSGWATSSNKCQEGNSYFEIRSECMMMDVKKWYNPEILDHIKPRPLSVVSGKWGVSAENVLWDSIRDRLDGQLHKCKMFGVDRFVKHEGIVWHCSNPIEDYQLLFDREGIKMDEGFRVSGWVHHPGYEG